MPPIPTDHLQAIIAWLEQLESIPLPNEQAPGLSTQDKQELRRVEALIEQLRSHGVAAIPAELVAKKLDLQDRDVPETPPSEAARHLPNLEQLCVSLGDLARKARLLRNQIRSRTRGQGPRAHYHVEPIDLLQAGYLSTEDRLELWWSNTSGVFEGRLESDGRIRAKTQDGWKAFDSLSSAAQYISGRAQNGWEHWRRVNADGSHTKLKEIRDQFMEENGDD